MIGKTTQSICAGGIDGGIVAGQGIGMIQVKVGSEDLTNGAGG